MIENSSLPKLLVGVCRCGLTVLFIKVKVRSAFQTLLRVCAENFQSYSIVAGYRTHCIHNVYCILGEKGHWEVPRSGLDEVMQFVELLVEIENC